MPTPPDELRRRQDEARDLIFLLLLDWAEGRDPWSVVSAELESLLRDGHADAYRLGRNHAGDTAPDPEQDAAGGDAAWESTAGGKSQAAYWQGLNADVEAGRYGDPDNDANPPKPKALANRVTLYTHNWTATANDAWVASMPEDTLYWWRLGRGIKSEHCPSCSEWAAGGPYTAEALPAVPGDGSSECGSLCACEIETDDGMEGFSR